MSLKELAPGVAPDHVTLEHYRTGDSLVRSFMASYYASRAAMLTSASMLQHYLENFSNLTPGDIDGILSAMEFRADKAANSINDEELVRQLERIVLITAKNAVQRRKDAEARERRDQVRGPAHPKQTLKMRQRRRHVIFGKEEVTSAVPALLVGPPNLVHRAVTAIVEAMEKTTASRIIRCEDVEQTATWTLRPAPTPQVVTLHLPWWDGAFSNLERFRVLIKAAEAKLGGATDILVVDDLARDPASKTIITQVPQNYVARAAFMFKRMGALARGKGGVLVAGLKFRAGEKYDQRELNALSEKCRLYNLSEENGLLYAEDSYGNNQVIVEPGEVEWTAQTSSSDSNAQPVTTP